MTGALNVPSSNVVRPSMRNLRRDIICVCVGVGEGNRVKKKTNQLYRPTRNTRKRWKQTEWHLIFYDTTHTRHARGFAGENSLFPDRADYRRFGARTSTGARAQRNRGDSGSRGGGGGGGRRGLILNRNDPTPVVGKEKWGTCPGRCAWRGGVIWYRRCITIR